MVSHNIEQIQSAESKYARKLPDFKVGDTIKMKIKVQEADKVRLHPFEGLVIRKTGRGLKGTFTVRKISFGEGVERIFPIHSPVIEELSVVSKGSSKRANLYYLRGQVGKKLRIQQQEASPQPQPVA